MYKTKKFLKQEICETCIKRVCLFLTLAYILGLLGDSHRNTGLKGYSILDERKGNRKKERKCYHKTMRQNLVKNSRVNIIACVSISLVAMRGLFCTNNYINRT